MASLPTGAPAQDEWLRRTIMPHLVDLHTEVGHTVSLAVLHHDTVVYLETVHDQRQSRAFRPTGPRAPTHATAAGKLLLAHSPMLTDLYGADATLDPLTEHTITTVADLEVELSRIRRDGVAFNREEYVPGLVGVAGQIVGPAGVAIAAITIGGPAESVDLAAVTQRLRAAIHAASATVRRATPGYTDAS